MAVLEMPITGDPGLGGRFGDGVVFVPRTGRGRADRRRLARTLADVWCRRGLRCLVGPLPEVGARQVVLEWGSGDERFGDLVAALASDGRTETVVVGAVALATRHVLPPDVLAVAGAAGLAASIGRRTGTRPAWEVQAGRTPASAALLYIERHRPDLVTYAHAPHGPHRRCAGIEVAVRTGTGTALLLA